MPLRNQTTLKQERAVYELFKQLVQGKDVPATHILRRLKLKGNEDNGKAWRIIPKLFQEFGLYEHTVKQIYNSFLSNGANGARMGIIILSITDESVCGLVRRYATQEELQTLFNWPTIWTACEGYKHRWCPDRAAS